MTMESFTQKAQQAISESQQLALKNHNPQVDGEHLHAALLSQSDGLIPRLAQLMGVEVRRYQADVDALEAWATGTNTALGELEQGIADVEQLAADNLQLSKEYADNGVQSEAMLR